MGTERRRSMMTAQPDPDYWRVSSATAFLAQASSIGHRGVVEGPGDPAREAVEADDRVVSAKSWSLRPARARLRGLTPATGPGDAGLRPPLCFVD